MAVAYYALTSAYNVTFGAGVKLNRQYESMSNGLAAIISSNTQYIKSNGDKASSLEKFNKAQEVTKRFT